MPVFLFCELIGTADVSDVNYQ